MQPNARIFVAGHRGLVGSAIARKFLAGGYTGLIVRSHAELDLENQGKVEEFFSRERPEFVVIAAAKVGGIHANSTYPVDFLLRNLKIQNNTIEASFRYGVQGLLFLGSSCIYPRLAPQPIREDSLLGGPLEPTNEAYAIAKIAGMKLCGAYNRQYGTRFMCVMPTNLYGPNDNYNLENSHVLPALIRKFHLARLACAGDWGSIEADEKRYGPIPQDILSFLVALSRANSREVPASVAHLPAAEPVVKLWGTGSPLREFLHADDMAEACVFLMERMEELFADGSLSPSTDYSLNIGSGSDLPIRELAGITAEAVGYDGPVEWDATKPDGTPRKLLDCSRINALGWKARISLAEGIRHTYQDYLEGVERG